MVNDITLQKLIPYSVFLMPLVWVKSDEKPWVVTTLLNRYLGSYIDCIAVIDKGEIVGAIDGRDLLAAVFHNPSYNFFEDAIAEDIMIKTELIGNLQMKISDLLETWKHTRRYYMILKNSHELLCMISARTLVEAHGIFPDNTSSSNIQKSKIVTCSQNDTIGNVLDLMFKKKTRRIFYDDIMNFVSDRCIIKKIIEVEFLRKTDDFLGLPISTVSPLSPILADNDQSIENLIKIMTTHEQPCVVFPDNTVMTYLDIVNSIQVT